MPTLAIPTKHSKPAWPHTKHPSPFRRQQCRMFPKNPANIGPIAAIRTLLGRPLDGFHHERKGLGRHVEPRFVQHSVLPGQAAVVTAGRCRRGRSHHRRSSTGKGPATVQVVDVVVVRRQRAHLRVIDGGEGGIDDEHSCRHLAAESEEGREKTEMKHKLIKRLGCVRFRCCVALVRKS